MTKLEFKFGLGDLVVDESGFKGTITGLCVWRDGSQGACLTALVDGKVVNEWFNEDFLTKGK